MRALVLTSLKPPEDEAERGGMHRRVGAMLQAMAPRFERIDMLHMPAPGCETDSARQSAFWGLPLHTAMLTREERLPSAWQHYGRGMADLGQQHPYSRYASPSLLQALQTYLDTRPDLIVVDRLEAMVALRRCRTAAPILFDLNDVLHSVAREVLSQAPLSLRTALDWLRWPALRREERLAGRLATRTAVCSQADAVYLRRKRFPGSIVTIPNAIAMPATAPGLGTRPTVLLLGTYGYPPNAVAAQRLVTRIWPSIIGQMPNARLILAGPGSDTLPSRAGADASIEFRGFVPDLAALYAETRVVCCPLIEGGGTRLKLIEAAAYARPMVSTAKGAEGLDFIDGQDIIIAETNQALAEGCLALLRDADACARLGAAARVTAARYDLPAVVGQIGAILDGMMSSALHTVSHPNQ